MRRRISLKFRTSTVPNKELTGLMEAQTNANFRQKITYLISKRKKICKNIILHEQ